MKKDLFSVLFLLLILSALTACEKEIQVDHTNQSTTVSCFSVNITDRTASTALLQWTAPTCLPDGEKIRYKVLIDNVEIANGIEGNSFRVENLSPVACTGQVIAYTGNSASDRAIPLAVHFVIPQYTAVSPYNAIAGYYKVTETSTNLSTGAISNYVFVGRVLTMSNSIIRFVQNRRVPQTWWGTDFDTQVYPSLNDSLMGLGTTPRGRILSQDSIRMSYLYGSTVVYDVRQIWQKFANPADTATVTFTYPNFPGMITTVAGNNLSGVGSGTSGDGGPATAAALLNVSDVLCDNIGNFYFTDGANTNYSIRKVDANGIVTRFAGNNTAGFSGDGGAATAAQLNYPQGLAIDNSGNVLIADAVNRVIRQVDASGFITTIAGIPGSYGYSGDGGPATAAQLGSPAGMCVDPAGNIYFTDPGKHVVRKIDTNGIITTVAGIAGASGSFSGDGGPANAARLNFPYDVCMDPAGNLYIADKGNHAIRKIDLSGIISTVAGIGGSLNYGFTGDGGAATAAKLNNPTSVSLDPSGNLFISDNTNNRIRIVNTNGIISTLVGNGQAALLGDGPDFYAGDYGPALAASIGSPKGIFWINNQLYIATSYRIRRVVY